MMYSTEECDWRENTYGHTELVRPTKQASQLGHI